MPSSLHLANNAHQTLQIIAIGDCNTSGAIEHGTHFNVPLQLCEKLQSLDISCQLNNYGTTMSTCREGLKLAYDHKDKADWLLLNFGLVDTWVTSIPQVYISYYPDNVFKKRCRKLLKSLKKRLRTAAKKGWVRSGIVVEATEYQDKMARIITQLQIQNSNLNIIIWGSAPTDDPQRNARLKEYDVFLHQLAKQHKRAHFIDSKQLIESAIESGTPRDMLFDDNVHLSAQGAKIIADAMFPIISSSK